MENFKQLQLPMYDDLYDELMFMLSAKMISWSSNQQICINTIPTDPDNIHLGVGSLDHDWNNAYKIEENGLKKLIVKKFEVPLKDKDFTQICTQFKNTSFEDIFDSLKKHYKIGRVRIMLSNPKTCLSWHVDHTPRIHLPIKTQEGCFMVIENEVLHMPENTWWWTNTVKLHTAFNGSKESRIHLVACLIDE